MSGTDRLGRSDALHARVRRFIDGGSTEGFDELAMDLATFQLDHVEPVRRLTHARLGRGPRAVVEIAALPTDVFRMRRIAAHPREEDVRVFCTSGTTSGARGSHAFRTLETYDAAAMAQAASLLWPDGAPADALVLAPSSVTAPDSSLSFMIDLFIDRLELRAEHFMDPSTGLDADRLVRHLAAIDRGGPVLVMGTAFAYVHLLDALGAQHFGLPAGSRAMLTGGFKGRSREVPEAELRASLERVFALEPSHVIGEYGMTELSSQLYEPRLVSPVDGPSTYRPPAWLRVDAADPETLEVLPREREGIARIVDLANVDSAVAVQTQDRVRVHANGDVTLLGRLPGATPRGCSLAIEEIVARRPTP